MGLQRAQMRADRGLGYSQMISRRIDSAAVHNGAKDM